MRRDDLFLPAPREIRVAGVLTTLPGLAAVVFAVVLFVDALLGTTETSGGNSVYGQAFYYVLLGAAMIACGIGLLLGHTWARTPAFVLALIVGGVGWYALGPSGQPLWGVPILVMAVVLVVLLFRAPSRAWALGEYPDKVDSE
ncbi:hypothetical protein [Haloechinothrix salitolerans]|uniref:Integral membrane protein n=1 Tax=Haloechinothrix salitolerans TaxID=926830 RepID=A0ABW2BZG2_9PSEU